MSTWLGSFRTNSSNDIRAASHDKTVHSDRNLFWQSDDRRLSLSRIPVFSHCGSFILLFHGELYNHLDLRASLRFNLWTGDSADETLVEGLSQKGPSLLLDVQGSFVFAAYDIKRSQLLLGRDRVGVQSFYTTWQADRLLFSNDPSLLPPRQLHDHELVKSYLISGHSGCHTSFPSSDSCGISSFPPGSIVRVNPGRPNDVTRYWPSQPRPNWTPLPVRDRSCASPFLRRLLDDVLLQQTVNTSNPIILLSTGIGSTCLSALACRVKPKAITTLSIVLPGLKDILDDHARLFSSYYDSLHESIHIAESKALSWLEQGLNDLNLIQISHPYHFLLMRAVSEQGIHSFFCGHGSSDLFGGISSLQRLPHWIALILRLPCFLRGPLHNMLNSCLHFPPSSSDYYSVQPFSLLSGEYDHSHSSLNSVQSRQLIPPYHHRISQYWGRICWFNLFGFTEPNILRPLSALCSMFDIVAHFPFLDHRIVEACVRIPQRYHRPGYGLLLDACKDIYSPDLFNHANTSNLLPMSRWMLGPLSSLCYSRIQSLAKLGLFDSLWLRSQWSAFEADQLSWQHIWRLVVLGSIGLRDF